MNPRKEIIQPRLFPNFARVGSLTAWNNDRRKSMDENISKNTVALALMGLLTFLLIQACAPKPFQVKLNPNLGTEAITRIAAHQPCPKTYRLALDEKSTAFEVKTRPQNCCYPGLSLDWVFPIGKTLSGYLAQAQQRHIGETIPLQLDMSDFRFVMDATSTERPYVDSLKYKAHFTGPDPIGFLTISETAYGSMPIKGGELKMYDAVSQALRSTTVKLFSEVANRMCGSS